MDIKGKAILYIASSLDGYIAGENDDLSFLSSVEKPNIDYGYAEFIKNIDTIIMGRRTYDWIINNVSQYIHNHVETYIITNREIDNQPNLIAYAGDIKKLLRSLKHDQKKNVFIEGGGEIIQQLLVEKLIDEFYISIVPIILGKGIRLFSGPVPEQKLELVNSKEFNTGLVTLHYKLQK